MTPEQEAALHNYVGDWDGFDIGSAIAALLAERDALKKALIIARECLLIGGGISLICDVSKTLTVLDHAIAGVEVRL